MTTGIIAEYNPFHNGHKYMLKQIREQFPQEPIIICLSGSITQRGEMALLGKWTRAKLAVLGGANLVIELPAVFACRSAEAFAQGGTALLTATGLVDKRLLPLSQMYILGNCNNCYSKACPMELLLPV